MKKIISCLVLLVSSLTLIACSPERSYDLTEFEDKVSSVVEQVLPSVVSVQSNSETSGGHGSGIIYKIEQTLLSKTYYVLTNYHVIEGSSSLLIKFYDDTLPIYADVYAFDQSEDLAILTFSSNVIFRVHEIKNVDVKRGEFCIAIGSPISLSYKNTATFGMISNVSDEEIQHDASINFGNSGGPLFNLNGDLIGINTRKIVTTINKGETVPVEGMGFAISIGNVIKVVDSLKEGDYLFSSVKLGITIVAKTDFLTNYPSYASYIPADQDGVVIVDIDPRRPCYSHLFIYDLIYKANGIDVKNNADLSTALGTLKEGQTHKFLVYRKEGDSFVSKEVVITL